MNDQPIDNAGMPDEIDFSDGTRGLHHIPPGAKVFLPACVEIYPDPAPLRSPGETC